MHISIVGGRVGDPVDAGLDWNALGVASKEMTIICETLFSLARAKIIQVPR